MSMSSRSVKSTLYSSSTTRKVTINATGLRVGSGVGVGGLVGRKVGRGVGEGVGAVVGVAVGLGVGEAVGLAVGEGTGDGLGRAVADGIGVTLGEALAERAGEAVAGTRPQPLNTATPTRTTSNRRGAKGIDQKICGDQGVTDVVNRASARAWPPGVVSWVRPARASWAKVNAPR